MSCSLIEIIRGRKGSSGSLRHPGVESAPQGYVCRDPKPALGISSVSHPGFPHPAGANQSSSNTLRAFTLPELKSATKNFAVHLQLGEGGFGLVYKGSIKQAEEKVEVAIKQLNTSGLQGHHEWVTEVHFLGMVDNPYLVKLIGYCADDDEKGIQRLLVYEYMPNRGLDGHIFRAGAPALSWQTRIKVALGAARGLAYLHEEKGVIFRDFKTANILLDEEFNPKLSDFGLARQGPDAGKTHVTTGVKGTYGYAAPEYIQTGHLTFKSDVFSFGVVLLEILTGRRAMDRTRPRMEQRLLEWVKPYINDSSQFYLAVDPRLENLYPTKAAMKFATIAIQCLVKQPKARPKMNAIVEGLKKVQDMTYRWENSGSTPSITASKSETPETLIENAYNYKPSRQTSTLTTRDTARDRARDNRVRDTARDTTRDTSDNVRSPSNGKAVASWDRLNPPAFPLPSIESSIERPNAETSPTSSEEGAKSPARRARRPRDPALALETVMQSVHQGVNQMPVYYPDVRDVSRDINQRPVHYPSVYERHVEGVGGQGRLNHTRHGMDTKLRHLTPA